MSLKEKFTAKLSRLLSDSPAASSKGQQYSTDDLVHPEKGSLSSLVFSLLPTISNGFDEYNLNKLNSQCSPAPSALLSSRLKSLYSRWSDRPLDRCEEYGYQHGGYETLADCEDENCVSEQKVNGSDKFEEPSTSLGTSFSCDSAKSLPVLMDESSLLSSHLIEFLHSCIPNIVKGRKWILLYSTMRHGISLRTLLRKSFDLPGPCLLIVADMQGAVFGGLLECPIKLSPNRKYQGTNETFVFTTKYGEPRLFRATGANRYYYLCLDDLLALGGGGNFALSLDEDLLHGTSGPCETFRNTCLAHSSDFELKSVELWGFSHSLR